MIDVVNVENVTIELAGIAMPVLFRKVKKIRIEVCPPDGRVEVIAPIGTRVDVVRAMCISALSQIRKKRAEFQAQEREPMREMLGRESHYLWGDRYLLQIVEEDGPAHVEHKVKEIVLHVPNSWGHAERYRLLSKWYREQVRQEATRFLAKWEPVIGVEVEKVFVQHMKTEWASCVVATRHIRLNTELAKKDRQLFQYIIVNMLCRLKANGNTKGFEALMDNYLPNWWNYRQWLNQTALGVNKTEE